MRGAFLADGFFRDLDENFLAFFQQIADQGNGSILPTRSATASTPGAKASSTATAAATIEGRALGALGVAGGAGGCAHFNARIDGAIAAGLGVEQGFGFRLGVFDFGIDTLLLPLFLRFGLSGKSFAGRRGCWLIARGGLLRGFRRGMGLRLTGSSDFKGARRLIVPGRAGFLFHFLKDCVFFQFFHVVGKVGFFLVDDLLLDRSRRLGVRG